MGNWYRQVRAHEMAERNELAWLRDQNRIMTAALRQIAQREPVHQSDCVYHYAGWAAQTAREALAQAERTQPNEDTRTTA
jgi:hypothetical protein